MKNAIPLAIALLVLGCDSPADEGEAEQPREVIMNSPPALEGCRTFHVHSKTPGYASMIITRCPSSITTTRTEEASVTVSEHADEPDE